MQKGHCDVRFSPSFCCLCISSLVLKVFKFSSDKKNIELKKKIKLNFQVTEKFEIIKGNPEFSSDKKIGIEKRSN